MRILVRTESEAFRLVLALLLTGAIAVAIGAIFTPLVGLVFFAVVVVATLLWDVGTVRATKAPLESAASVGRARGRRAAADRQGEETSESEGGAARSRPRILIVAGDEPTGEALWEQIYADGYTRPVLDVVAPVLQSRTHFVTTDIDTETEAARLRLRHTLAWATEHGLEANGVVGDPIAPLGRIEDELREHEYVEAIVLTRPESSGAWLENDVLKHMREELNVPVRQLVGTRRDEQAV